MELQAKQGFGEGVEYTTTSSKRPLFPHKLLSIHLGAIQILPLEAILDLLEKSRLQSRSIFLHPVCCCYSWHNLLASWH